MTSETDFEAVVARRIETELGTFLARHRVRYPLAVHVVTNRPLHSRARAANTEWVRRSAGSYDVAARVKYVLDEQVEDPEGVVVRIARDQPSNDGPPTRGPGADGHAHAEAESEPQLLTIEASGGLSLAYQLAGSAFVSLHRPDGEGDQPGIALPRSLVAVPSGDLLKIRYVERTLEFHRTDHRPEVRISIDDRPLGPGQADYASATAHIGYRSTEARGTTALTVRVSPWRDDDLPIGRQPAPDQTPFRTSMRGVNGHVDLAVRQPARWPPRRHAFPVSRGGGEYADIKAQVHYTTATSRDGRAWHVKIYRCAVAQQAAVLRRHFTTQATLINQVNFTCGTTREQRRWAVAPISVLAGEADEGAFVTATVLGAGPETLLADPDHRLPAWFGVGADAPGCYLLVVAPLLEPVKFAEDRPVPGVEAVPAFATMATGLDACHELHVAHCDIKPDNVCWEVDTQSYVLVDADAVTRTDTSVMRLRFTERYAGQKLREWARRARVPSSTGIPVDEERLRAHDRFGFVVVVLAAVAGSAWVQTLIDSTADDPRRLADRPDDVRTALYHLWGPRWRNLADALAEPFAPDALSGEGPWAAAWLSRVQAACATPARPVVDPDPRDAGHPETLPDVGPWAEAISAIRDGVRAKPVPNHQKAAVVRAAVARRATEAARTAALIRFCWTVALMAAIPAVLLIGRLLH